MGPMGHGERCPDCLYTVETIDVADRPQLLRKSLGCPIRSAAVLPEDQIVVTLLRQLSATRLIAAVPLKDRRQHDSHMIRAISLHQRRRACRSDALARLRRQRLAAPVRGADWRRFRGRTRGTDHDHPDVGRTGSASRATHTGRSLERQSVAALSLPRPLPGRPQNCGDGVPTIGRAVPTSRSRSHDCAVAVRTFPHPLPVAGCLAPTPRRFGRRCLPNLGCHMRQHCAERLPTQMIGASRRMG
jgi:hypothetical protein